MEHSGHCQCGKSYFDIKGDPLLRAICHCEICQTFNEAPYADITVFNTKDIEFPEDNIVDFKSYAKPPLLRRGKCSACHKPAIEFLKLPLATGITIIPSGNIKDRSKVPHLSFHSFYHRRKADVDDGLPKYSGYLPSQLGFMFRLIKARLG